MRLSADHPLDNVELAWALERRAARHPMLAIVQQSGRTEAEWNRAMRHDQVAFAPNAVIAERYALVSEALTIGLSIDLMSIAVRAPRAWCVEAGRREMARRYGTAA